MAKESEVPSVPEQSIIPNTNLQTSETKTNPSGTAITLSSTAPDNPTKTSGTSSEQSIIPDTNLNISGTNTNSSGTAITLSSTAADNPTNTSGISTHTSVTSSKQSIIPYTNLTISGPNTNPSGPTRTLSSTSTSGTSTNTPGAFTNTTSVTFTSVANSMAASAVTGTRSNVNPKRNQKNKRSAKQNGKASSAKVYEVRSFSEDLPNYVEDMVYLIKYGMYCTMMCGIASFLSSLFGIIGAVLRSSVCIKISVWGSSIGILAEIGTISYIFLGHDKSQNRNRYELFENLVNNLCQSASVCVRPWLLIVIGSTLSLIIMLKVPSIAISNGFFRLNVSNKTIKAHQFQMLCSMGPPYAFGPYYPSGPTVMPYRYGSSMNPYPNDPYNVNNNNYNPNFGNSLQQPQRTVNIIT